MTPADPLTTAGRGGTAGESGVLSGPAGGAERRDLAWARGVTACAPHHTDGEIVEACHLILRQSGDHTDQVRARALLDIIEAGL